MNLVELTQFLVENIIKESDKDKIVVSEEKNDFEIIIKVQVPEEDMSMVIGRNGAIANSIRTIVQAAAYTAKIGRVRVNIDSL